MTENKMIILADDLTGANDTAIQFVKHGLNALVITTMQSPESVINASYEILSFNSDSRDMDESAAYTAIRKIIARLNTLQLKGKYYKKVDSVLRGNPGPELAALMDELDIPFAIAAPSFPANRSTLQQGMLKSGLSNTSIDAIKLFSSTMNKKVEGIPLEKIRLGEQLAADYVISRRSTGVEVFVADAVNDEDLAIIYRLSTLLDTKLSHFHVLAGSAGLANHIAKSQKSEKAGDIQIKPVFHSDNNFPVLLIAGTKQGETASQITTLSKKVPVKIVRFRTDLALNGRGEEAQNLAYKEASENMKNNPKLCVVVVDCMFETGIPEGDVVRRIDASILPAIVSLAKLAQALMETFLFKVIISTGGDTSLELCKGLGIQGIHPLAEISPGIPIGRIVGGSYENTYMITKSGRFGDENTFIEVMNFLGEDYGS